MTPTDWTFFCPPTPDGKIGTIGQPILQLADGVCFPERTDLVAVPPDRRVVIRLCLEVEDGRPACTSLAFERATPMDAAKGATITAKLVRSVDVRGLIESAISWQAEQATRLVATLASAFGEQGFTVDERGHLSFWTPEHAQQARAGALALRRQRSINDELLREVARVYLAADSAPTEAVADELGTSKRNATRWVAMARQRGFLPPYIRSTEED